MSISISVIMCLRHEMYVLKCHKKYQITICKCTNFTTDHHLNFSCFFCLSYYFSVEMEHSVWEWLPWESLTLQHITTWIFPAFSVCPIIFLSKWSIRCESDCHERVTSVHRSQGVHWHMKTTATFTTCGGASRTLGHFRCKKLVNCQDLFLWNFSYLSNTSLDMSRQKLGKSGMIWSTGSPCHGPVRPCTLVALGL